MATGYKGTFVISWSQTAVDGLDAAPVASLVTGAAWSWSGEATRVDGPANVLQLDRTEDEAKIRKGAERMARRLWGGAGGKARVRNGEHADDILLQDDAFAVTDGRRLYTVSLLKRHDPTFPPLLMFIDVLPPRQTDLWIVRHTAHPRTIASKARRPERGVICFTPGTDIATPGGPRRVEDLVEGDLVQTRDNGAQPIRWIGKRRFTGARLFALPQFRPIRIDAAALGSGQPDQTLLVSPDHRMLIRGPEAQALFNTDEVLITARHLVNGKTVTVDRMARDVTYIHLLLPRHEILFANGLGTESFHPAGAGLDLLVPSDRTRLRALVPGVERNPFTYGATVRRVLSQPEAAILLNDAA